MRELSAERVEVAGPRGATVMAGEDLDAWMARSGFSASARRWFSGGDDAVVAVARHETLAAALEGAGLTEDDEEPART